LLVSAQTAKIYHAQQLHEQAMLIKIYVAAPLVNGELADQAWDAREFDVLTACVACWSVAAECLQRV